MKKGTASMSLKKALAVNNVLTRKLNAAVEEIEIFRTSVKNLSRVCYEQQKELLKLRNISIVDGRISRRKALKTRKSSSSDESDA